MEIVLEWLRANNDVFGFGVATLIFLITIVLVSRKMIGFWITLLFLLFSLFSGLMIANQGTFKEWLLSQKNEMVPEVSEELSTETN